MKGRDPDRSIRRRMRIPRAGVLAAAVGSAILGTALSSAAGAQEIPSSSAAQERDKAPIGHRQPRPQDLPQSVVREENRPNGSGHAFDRRLENRICRGC
jgi:hypothetical protein